MRNKPKLVLVGLLALPLLGQHVSPRPAEVTNTERHPLAPGGLIRIDDSVGLLKVEGWDQPDVEITVIKSTTRFYEDTPPKDAMNRLESVRVTAKSQSDAELVISTQPPPRRHFWPMSPTGESGVTIQYRIRAPRASRLAIRHGGGSLLVGNMIGDVDATNRNGDIVLLLPSKVPYSIDARCKVGPIESDFAGDSHAHYLVGRRFSNGSPDGARRISLRMGLGGITIKTLPPEPELAVTTPVSD